MSANPDGPYHGSKGKVTKLGLVSNTVHFVAESFADVFRIIRENPTYQGLPRADSDFSQRPGKCFDVWITYEGQADDQSYGGLQSDEQDWEFIPEWSEERMENHPFLDVLMSKYLGYWEEGKVAWPETAEQFMQKAFPMRRKPKQYAKNPMLGRDTYFVTGGTVRLTTLESRVPSDAYRNVNRILKTLPIHDLAHVEWGDRDWIETDPTPRKRGNLIEFTREFKMSPPGGWGPEMQILIDQR